MSSLKTKNTKQVDLFKELDDATLATMLQESDMIRFIDSNHAYSWDEDTLLWTPINSKQQINTMVCEILEPIIEERKKALKKLKIEAMEDNDDTKIVRIAKALKQCQSIGSATKVKNIIAMAGRSVVSQEFFNKKTLTQNLLPIRNGYCLDLVTLEKRKREKNDYFTFETNNDLTENTKDAEAFLKQYCPKKDNDTYTYLTEILGYCITPWNFMKSFFVFYGESGDNGKSALLNIMEKIMGNSLYTSVDKKMFTQMKHSGGATPELCQCVGKWLGTYGETTNELLDDTTIKMITGQDTITIRPLYGESIAVRLVMKLLLSGNELPSWKHTQAMQNRVMFFEFLNEFVSNPTMSHHRKKDESLVNNFLNKKSYRDQFFTIIIKSASNLYKNRKFTKSDYMEKQKSLYINGIDTSDKFLRMLVPKKSGSTCGELFDDYIDWCKNENLKCESKGVFAKKLSRMFKPRDKKLHGNTVYDFAIPADCDNKFVGSDSDGLKRQLISAENENQRLAKEIEKLQKLVLQLQEKKQTEQTNYERAEQRKVDAITNAMNKYFQKADESDSDLDSIDEDDLDSIDEDASDNDEEYSVKFN
jgi:phage/plasmid-associated DNA primase